MSQYLDSLSIGDTVLCRGPSGKVEYCGQGLFRIKEPGKPQRERVARQVGLIAGGTGITPILQILRAVLKDTEDDTEVSLLFANQVGAHLEVGTSSLDWRHNCEVELPGCSRADVDGVLCLLSAVERR